MTAAQSGAGQKAAEIVRNAEAAAGFTPGTYLGGTNGIAQTQSAVPSLVSIPQVYIDLGNLNNADDAAALGTKAGQTKYAVALTNGLIQYLTGKVTPAGAVAKPIKQDPIVPTVPQITIPTPGTTGTGTGVSLPTATVPTVTPVQSPIVPSVAGVTGQTTSPIVAGVPMLGGGSSGGVQQVVQQVTQPAPSVDIPGLGSLQMPQMPTFVSGGQLTSMIQQMAPQAQQFVTSTAGQQLIEKMFTDPQAFNSLAASQGPGVAQQVIKAVLGASSLLPGLSS
ncbi:hypothetical protein [Tsukamurella soli]|uniref:hypothetical protein n=1 Tax=Tsukamurella soli TaxID=644556 RepID=UPI00360A9579